MSKSKLSAKCLLSEIDLSKYNLGTIYHLKVSDIIKLEEIQERKLEDFLLPFLINLNEDNNINLFDLLFVQEEQFSTILLTLLDSLKIFYKTDKIEAYKDSHISINDAKIDRNNYNILCDVIREMFFIIKPQEKEPRIIEVSEENKALLEECLMHEKESEDRKKEQNKKTLHQMITIVASKNQWDYEKVLNMTYYRFLNTCASILNIDNYTTYMRYATSGNFDMKDQKQEHWTEIVGV